MCCALLVAAAWLAYAGTWRLPFVFDDHPAVVDNPTIRQLATAFDAPPAGNPSAGRPLLNLTFALNHAMGGLDPFPYRVTNWLIHVGCGLLLFGVIGRTWLRRAGTSAALPLAAAVALLWLVHPLQTETVIGVAQRTESLVAFFYLATLYAFVRATEGSGRRGWLAVSVAACLLGMASKEVMVTAPLLVLLYDRTFVAGSFVEAWRARRGYYAALAATWGLLLWLVLASGGTRGSAAGFGLGVAWWQYALKQAEAVVLYLRLAVWPHPLVMDYGTAVVTNPLDVAWQLAVVFLLLGATGWALVRRPVAGFLGAAFFLILAPSSSVVPLVAQTVAEHRVYLPLAAVLLLAGAGLQAWGGSRAALGLWLAAALPALWWTDRRAHDYRDDLTIWTDTVARAPRNPRAHYNLAGALLERGRIEEAVAHYEEAIRLNPADAGAHNNYALALLRLGRLEAAAGQAREAVRLQPGYADAHSNLGNILAQAGDWAGAQTALLTAIRLEPGLAEARNNLGGLLLQLDRPAEAVGHCAEAVRLQPGLAEARSNLGYALLRLGRPAEALEQYAALVRLAPEDVPAWNNLGYACLQLGRRAEAAAHFRAALRLDPQNATARRALAELGAP